MVGGESVGVGGGSSDAVGGGYRTYGCVRDFIACTVALYLTKIFNKKVLLFQK